MVQVTPFRGTETIARSVKERRNYLSELALQRGSQDIRRTEANTAAAKELRLSREQVQQAVSLLPSAIEDAAKSVSQLPAGSRLAAFNTTMTPILQQARASGIPVDELQESFSQLTEEDFTPEAIEEFSASVKQGIGADGKPLFFQVGNQGSVRPIEGVTPPPKSGESITVGPDGTVQISRGPGAQNISNKTQNTVQGELLELGDTLLQTRSIRQQFDPRYHQVSTRFNNALTAGKARLGADVSPQERADLESFASYKSGAANLQSQVIKAMSGAAVNAAEEARLRNFLIDAGSGIFDGDDPISAERKLAEFESLNEKIQARYQWILSQGLTPSDETFSQFPLDDMPRVMTERHNQILKELMNQNPEMPSAELKQQARQVLGQEFGLL